MSKPIAILSASRTPMGGMLGSLSSVSAADLGAAAISAAVQKSTLGVDQIDEVLMGCVLSAGVGQAPARQAALLRCLREPAVNRRNRPMRIIGVVNHCPMLRPLASTSHCNCWSGSRKNSTVKRLRP